MTPPSGQTLTRRQALAAGATVVGGVLAIGGSREAAATPTTRSRALYVAQNAGGEFRGGAIFQKPPAGTFNSFAVNAITGTNYWDLLEMPLAMFRWDTGEYIPLLATAWELVPPDTFNVTLREGVVWSDGSPFTSRDVVDTFTILRLQSGAAWTYLDSVVAEDDLHLTFTMKEPSTVAERFVLRERIRASSVYGPFAEEIQEFLDGGGTPESEDATPVRTKIEEFKPEQMVASGPYQIDPASVTDAQMTLNKVVTAWNADKVAFDTLVLFNGDTGAATPILLARQMDYSSDAFPPATERALAEAGFQIVRTPLYGGPALYFNYNKLPAAGDVRFRQALAAAINRDENATVALDQSARSPKYMAGFGDSGLPNWLAEEDLEALDPYPFDQDAAASMLEELGYSKDGDTWKSDDGEELSYELLAPAEYTDYAAAAVNLGEQLSDFGIETTVRAVQYQQFFADVREGNFELAVCDWGVPFPHPVESYRLDLLLYNTPPNVPGAGFPLQQETTSVGPVDFTTLVPESAAGLDAEAQREAVTKLAKAFNELLPIIPLWERLANDPFLDGERVTDWPDPNDPVYGSPVYADSSIVMMILDGTLHSV